MRLDARAVAGFLADPGRCRAVLLFGGDVGLIRERSDALTRAVAGALDDPFLVASLVRESHARLAEEASALSLIGGRRVVRVREAADGLAGVLGQHLGGNADALVILEGPDLPTRSKLRTLLEGHALGAAIGCYPLEGRALGETVRAALADAGLRADADALALLQSLLGADQAQTRSELEKLVLYKGAAGGVVGVEDVAACVGDAAGLSAMEAVSAALAGQVAPADRALVAALGEGAAAVGILRIAQGQMHRLHRARLAVAAGASIVEAAERAKPPVFFKEKPGFIRALGLWSVAAIEDGLAHLFAAEAACKRTGAPDRTIAEGAILRVAARAARAGRR